VSDKIKTIYLNDLQIGIDGFNVRPLDEDTVQRYQEVVDRLPPVEGWQDPGTGEIFLLDGRHRCEARRREGFNDVALLMFNGSRVDAEVRAFSANLPHPLPLTKLQRRKAITEIVRRRYSRSNSWISEEAGCSPPTVAKIREALEAEGVVPVLDRLDRKGGGTVPREYNRVNTEDRSDSLLGNTPDFFDEAAQAEKANREKKDVEAPDDLHNRGGSRSARDGGYNISEDGDDGDDDSGGPLITGLEASDPTVLEKLGRYQDSRDVQQRTLKFAHLGGSGLSIEVVIYVDDQPYSVPVTMMLSQGQIHGVPQNSLPEDGQSALILSAETARQMKLV